MSIGRSAILPYAKLPASGNGIVSPSSGSSWTPQTPTGLTLTVISDTVIQADWTNIDTTGDGVKVYISTDNITFTLKDTVALGVATTNLTGLTEGTLYYVYAVAYKGAVESDPSNTDSDTTGIGFKTQWTVSGDITARTITLPLVTGYNYNCTVDWGDGSALSTVTAFNDADRIHTYTSNGTYIVRIVGTCEGWSFNNGGDKLKIVAIVHWGTSTAFNGFKYLTGAFYGCNNLASLGTGKILASGTGCTGSFGAIFYGCKFATIQAGLFDNHPLVTSFSSAFAFNAFLTTIPADLFRYATLVSADAFYYTFFQCTSFNNIPTDTFRYNTEVSTRGFMQTFRSCTSLTSIPVDLFRYNTKVSTYGFYDTFQTCTALLSIPQDIFRYNTAVSTYGFEGTFIECNKVTSLPDDLFKYNTLVSTSGFTVTFDGCTLLATLCADLFRYNVSCTSFYSTFSRCLKLQLRSDIWYQPGEEATRFIALDNTFRECFNRASFTGVQGTAPDLWNCTFPTKLEVSPTPSSAWVAGDIITGQTSGVTSEAVLRWTTWIWLVKNISGTYTSGEIIGVTGVPAKLADQSPGYPIATSGVVKTDCFNGAGNSLTSLSNYASIPAEWL